MASDINELISKEALDSVNKLEATFGRIVATLDTLVAKSKTLDQLISAMNKSADAQNAIGKAAKEAANLNKQLKDSEDDVVKAKIRFLNATKDQRDELKALVTLENEEAGYLEKVRAKIAQLNQEKNKVKETDKDWKKQISDLNKEIDKNNVILKENSSQLGKQKIGIGAYSQGIKDAVLNLASFGTLVALGTAALNKMKDAFFSTDQGAVLMGKWKGLMDAFWYSLSHMKDKSVDIAEATKAGGALAKLHEEERRNLVVEAKLNEDIKMLRLQAINDPANATKYLTEAEGKENDIIAKKLSLLDRQIAEEQNLWMETKSSALADDIAAKQAERYNIQGEHNLRIATKLGALKIKETKEEDIKLTEQQIEKSRAYAIALTEQLAAMERAGIAPVGGFGDKNGSIVSDSKISGKQQTKAADIGNDIDKANERILKAQEAADRKALQMKEQKANLEKELIQGVFSFEEQLIERKISKLEAQKNIELSAANLTAAQKTAINEKYAKKEGELKRKEAIAQKASSLFSIALSTAEGVMKATAALMLPLIPFIIAAGAVQAATVMAKPIPQYASGVLSSPEGLAIVGERGHELMIDPSGNMDLSGDLAELAYLKQGTKIIPSDETKKILSAANMSKNNNNEATQERRHKELLNTIKNKKELHLNVGVGHSIIERSGNNYSEYFNRHLQ